MSTSAFWILLCDLIAFFGRGCTPRVKDLKALIGQHDGWAFYWRNALTCLVRRIASHNWSTFIEDHAQFLESLNGQTA